MSYKPVHQAEAGQEEPYENGGLQNGVLHHPEPARPARRFFKTSDSLHTAISVAAGTVMCLFGYEQGVFGGIIVGEDFLEYFNHPSPGMQGFVTSVYDLGCFGGAVLTLAVGEKLGRKKMLIIFTIIMTVGILVQTGAHSMKAMVWGRIIAGIGNVSMGLLRPCSQANILPFSFYRAATQPRPRSGTSRLPTKAPKAAPSSKKWPSTSSASSSPTS